MYYIYTHTISKQMYECVFGSVDREKVQLVCEFCGVLNVWKWKIVDFEIKGMERREPPASNFNSWRWLFVMFLFYSCFFSYSCLVPVS